MEMQTQAKEQAKEQEQAQERLTAQEQAQAQERRAAHDLLELIITELKAITAGKANVDKELTATKASLKQLLANGTSELHEAVSSEAERMEKLQTELNNVQSTQTSLLDEKEQCEEKLLAATSVTTERDRRVLARQAGQLRGIQASSAAPGRAERRRRVAPLADLLDDDRRPDDGQLVRKDNNATLWDLMRPNN